jgi:hypothetical protein
MDVLATDLVEDSAPTSRYENRADRDVTRGFAYYANAGANAKSFIPKYGDTFARATVELARLDECVGKVVSTLPPRRMSLKVQTVKTGHPQVGNNSGELFPTWDRSGTGRTII